jgi:hypothetical protein
MAHKHDDVLVEVQAMLPDAGDVSQVYPDVGKVKGDDTQWWVMDADHNTFALAWYDGDDVLHTQSYHP